MTVDPVMENILTSCNTIAADRYRVEPFWYVLTGLVAAVSVMPVPPLPYSYAPIPSALPALIKAYRIQEKAANAGFDWENPADVWGKVKEEISEFSAEASGFETKDAVPEEQRKRMEQEMGDVIFSIINAARLYGIHPENALELTNRKFISRFNHMESAIKSNDKTFEDLSLDEMERLWQEAKDAE